MGRTAVAVLMVAVVIGACVGAAFATGVFDNGGGGEEDDWREHVGERTIFETEGTESSLAYTATYTGSAANTLLYMDEETGYWFINYAYERTYRIGWQTQTITGESNEWGMDSDYVETEIGIETINTKYHGQQECRHIRLTNEVIGHTEDQWIGVDDGIAYYVKAESVSGIGLQKVVTTSNLYYKSTDKVDVKIDFNVNVYAYEDITVSGAGKYQIGEEVILTATGNDFYGWYDFDVSVETPVSTDRTYKFNITSDKTFYALNESVDWTYTSGTEVTLTAGIELSSAKWEITPYYRNNGSVGETVTKEGSAPTYVFDVPGDYRMTIEGTTVSGETYKGYRILFVDGYLEQDYEFEYGDLTISDISLSTFANATLLASFVMRTSLPSLISLIVRNMIPSLLWSTST